MRVELVERVERRNQPCLEGARLLVGDHLQQWLRTELRRAYVSVFGRRTPAVGRIVGDGQYRLPGGAEARGSLVEGVDLGVHRGPEMAARDVVGRRPRGRPVTLPVGHRRAHVVVRAVERGGERAVKRHQFGGRDGQLRGVSGPQLRERHHYPAPTS